MSPPHPISMSSQCAPRQSTLNVVFLDLKRSSGWIMRPVLGEEACGCPRPHGILAPDRPGRLASPMDLLELVTVLERVHRHPEPVIFVRREPIHFDQTPERLDDKLFTVAHVVEDLSLEGEEAPVDPRRGLAELLNVRH